MPNLIRVAVIGAGAFGRNHLRVLHELELASSSTLSSRPEPEGRSGAPPVPNSAEAEGTGQRARVHLAAVVDANPTLRAEAAQRYNIPAFASVEELLHADLGLHAAIVAVPTVAHATVATQLFEANLDVLVEKPLSTNLAEADSLIALAASRSRILAAGHLERFNPAVTAALPRLTQPMFFEAHRLSIFTPRSLDVDVVLDLMIHDLDILLTMARSPVSEVRAVGLPVLSRKVDIANVRLEFRSGAIANLTASRVSTEQVRKLRLFQPAQYLSLDYARQELLTINVDPAFSAAAAASAANPVQAHPSQGLSFEKLDLPREEPLRLELEDFLHAVATRTAPRVPGTAARAALALALEINEAIAEHARRTGLASR